MMVNKNMISKNIQPGTVLFHNIFGYGRFIRYEEETHQYSGYAIVMFEAHDAICYIQRKNLTEVII